MPKRTLLAGVALAVLIPTSALGQSGSAPKFTDQPALVALSNGAYLHYRLDRRPRTQRVIIDGRRARIRAVEGEGDFAYHAFVFRPRIRTLGRYSVEIRVATQRARVLKDRLVVRRRHPRVVKP